MYKSPLDLKRYHVDGHSDRRRFTTTALQVNHVNFNFVRPRRGGVRL